MNDADPALQFFKEGEIDLYGALGVVKGASADEIKKGYRKQALKYHPDKQRPIGTTDNAAPSSSSLSSSPSSSSAAAKFQQIGFAYSVLSSESRRSRYDSTGRTDESMFEEGMDWNAYFKEMWTGEVSAKSLETFKKKYRHSKEEKEDILKGYEACKGNLPAIVDHVPFLSLREDKVRVEELIEDSIKAKEVTRYKGWDESRKDAKLIAQAEKKEAKEEKEAMEMAREMGVYDALFGKDAQTKGSNDKSKKRKGGQDKGDDKGDDDFAALQSIIAKRNEQRSGHIDGLIARLEADASKKANGGAKKSKKASLAAEPEEGPSEEHFERTRARLEANKAKSAKSRRS
ncbi:hypothetical protein CBS101457_005383 [Exobasidium rhododendri]|nr:hypothetical protein CBS101457_005383 [Exobasidium rhododendri]